MQIVFDRAAAKSTGLAVAGLLLVAALDGAWISYQMYEGATEMNAQTAHITIRAGGFLNTDLEIFDSDPNADVLTDLQVVRERAAAYRKLGFVSVEITTLHDSINVVGKSDALSRQKQSTIGRNDRTGL